jgi:hypothetical protein
VRCGRGEGHAGRREGGRHSEGSGRWAGRGRWR